MISHVQRRRAAARPAQHHPRRRQEPHDAGLHRLQLPRHGAVVLRRHGAVDPRRARSSGRRPSSTASPTRRKAFLGLFTGANVGQDAGAARAGSGGLSRGWRFSCGGWEPLAWSGGSPRFLRGKTRARISLSDRLRPVAISTRAFFARPRNSGLVLRARDSPSTCSSGTSAATARFPFVTTTMSFLRSAAYFASDPEACARGSFLIA